MIYTFRLKSQWDEPDKEDQGLGVPKAKKPAGPASLPLFWSCPACTLYNEGIIWQFNVISPYVGVDMTSCNKYYEDRTFICFYRRRTVLGL